MLSRRERIIAIVTVVILAALVADKFIITPTIARLQQLEAQKQQLLAELNEAKNLFERRRLMEKKRRQLLGDGLKSESEVESQVLHALGQWAQNSELTLTSVKPQRLLTINKGLQEITFTVAGKGSLQATAQFLWNVEKSLLPIKINDLQLGSANESGNDMSLQLRLSALYVANQNIRAEDKPDEDS
jgi:Tfp pilus assembly protein PilO